MAGELMKALDGSTPSDRCSHLWATDMATLHQMVPVPFLDANGRPREPWHLTDHETLGAFGEHRDMAGEDRLRALYREYEHELARCESRDVSTIQTLWAMLRDFTDAGGTHEAAQIRKHLLECWAWGKPEADAARASGRHHEWVAKRHTPRLHMLPGRLRGLT